MKKMVFLTIATVCLLTTSPLYTALPSGTTLTNIPASNPNFLHPSEWLTVPSSHEEGYVLRFRALFWDSTKGDLNVFLRYEDPEGTEGTTNFLIRNPNNSLSIYHRGLSLQSISSQPLEATLPTVDRWYEIRLYKNIVSFSFATSKDGPWTRFYNYTLPYENLTHTGYGFSSYEAPARYLQMAEFKFNPTPPASSALTLTPISTLSDPYYANPYEWYSLPSPLYSFTLRFKGRLGDEDDFMGDMSVYFKMRTTPTGPLKTVWFLMRSNHVNPSYIWYRDGFFPAYATGPIAEAFQTEMWHEIRFIGSQISFYKSSSSTGPWTEYASDSIEPIAHYVEYGFSSYTNAQPLYMSNFTLEPGLTELPGLEWVNNGRENFFNLETTYNATAGTAPLKVTTSSPETQLLSNLVYNPTFTALGDWEYKDTTNSHTWTFDDATGTWQNSTTGYQWSYSNPTALRWHHTASNTYWEYDENTESWTQLIDDGD